MSVAGHLSIQVEDYDARIRTFVPHYEHMIATVADVLRLGTPEAPTIVDLGIGTGALAARCIEARPKSRVIGIDADAAMLELARSRLAEHHDVELRVANFQDDALPACDAIVASISLHHVREEAAKRALYASCRSALRSGGMLINADCFPARTPRLAAWQRSLWLTHLEWTYSAEEAGKYLTSWADEDTYFPLEDELDWMRAAGFEPEVVWRAEGFAVIASTIAG